jgi:methylmalonyl-CoA mutase N-terminal domain/subunit
VRGSRRLPSLRDSGRAGAVRRLERGTARGSPYDDGVATTGDRRETDSGIEIKPVYTADDAERELELPGEFPFTRGPYRDMYRGRPWTIRQYAGFASAEETNERFRYLLERGQTGLSVAFDLPTQLGYDSDDPRAEGEVGRTGVAVDSVADMELLFEGIPLGDVSTSMTINAPAALLLLLYELVAEEQGVDGAQLRGTVQNDILKEYIARGNYIFPPRPSMRITTDLFAYCAERLPRWNTISISGYHIREAGSTAAQELAFTLANGIAYCEAAVAAGLSPDEFGARLSFFFNAHNYFFQEVAKFRAARRLWARIMQERFEATNARALALRFHAQTGGSTLTAQQPENNVVRVAIQALSAVAGGAQSIHTNAFDEALALPTERSARIALRTQQILAHEAGGTDTADPLGGSYFVEALTRELEERAWELIEHVDELGGAVAAIERGFVQEEIDQAAFRYQQDVERGVRVVVGVNRYSEDEAEPIELHRLDEESERRQLERTARVRAERNQEEAARALAEVRRTARGDANLLPPMREALRARCTIGEICGVLREEFGTYDAQRA